ncbi:hypothetical protein [Glycomyces buryatensis]|uniref:Uncharacterized protein n=1 Tax=Glycomyces buryatensis TaxID=2570927 RepID=A0A4S8QHM7_9ACTN|nr:hypothetical protein [Glycomyces buryatensis]THV40909.1 hypothetical protein FAB82_13745 [Glycomyces buryatensis]
MAVSDDDRSVELAEDDFSVLPDQTSDESDSGWGEAPPARTPRAKGRALSPRDLELLEDRPPHW